MFKAYVLFHRVTVILYPFEKIHPCFGYVFPWFSYLNTGDRVGSSLISLVYCFLLVIVLIYFNPELVTVLLLSLLGVRIIKSLDRMVIGVVKQPQRLGPCDKLLHGVVLR